MNFFHVKYKIIMIESTLYEKLFRVALCLRSFFLVLKFI